MEESPRRIEIFAPFEAALNLTKLILFQPFDLRKWCVMGSRPFWPCWEAAGAGTFQLGLEYRAEDFAIRRRAM